MIAGVSDLQAGAAGIVVATIMAVLSGLLLPRWTVKELIKASTEALKLKDKQLESKDREIELWKETAENYRLANAKMTEYSGKLIPVTEVATKALHALTASAHQGELDEIAHTEAPSEV